MEKLVKTSQVMYEYGVVLFLINVWLGPWLSQEYYLFFFHCKGCKIIQMDQQFSVESGVMKVCLGLPYLQNRYPSSYQSHDV